MSIKTICLNSKVNGKQPSLNDRVYSGVGLSIAITTTPFFMGNILEGENMERYELSDQMQKYIVSKDDKYIVGKTILNPSIGKPITTREGQTRADTSTFLSKDCKDDCEIVAGKDGFPQPKGEETMKKLTIRKLTEDECFRLMGFEDKDTEACRKVGQTTANIYHEAGDSIVTTVLMGIFGELLGIDYKAKIETYCDKLAGEVK